LLAAGAAAAGAAALAGAGAVAAGWLVVVAAGAGGLVLAAGAGGLVLAAGAGGLGFGGCWAIAKPPTNASKSAKKKIFLFIKTSFVVYPHCRASDLTTHTSCSSVFI
jgi:hypothetical protein